MSLVSIIVARDVVVSASIDRLTLCVSLNEILFLSVVVVVANAAGNTNWLYRDVHCLTSSFPNRHIMATVWLI